MIILLYVTKKTDNPNLSDQSTVLDGRRYCIVMDIILCKH